jgi:hypothetical protein
MPNSANSTGLLGIFATATDLLMLVTVLSFFWVLKGARRAGASPAAMVVPLVIALAWGTAWTFVPALAAARLAPPPGGQVLAIATTVLGLLSLQLRPSVRTYFKTADYGALVALGPWRIVYGALLLVMGQLGGLPPAFFWSAGIGDILVGLWSISLLSRISAVGDRELIAWNIIGLMDLLHVLALGAIHLRPFFLSHPDVVPPLNLLPLVGVPLFVALHIHSLSGLVRRGGQPVA